MDPAVDLLIPAPTPEHLAEIYSWDGLAAPVFPPGDFPVVVFRAVERSGWDGAVRVAAPDGLARLQALPARELARRGSPEERTWLAAGLPEHVRIGSRLLRTSGLPLVMGILNVTPDSFSDGGLHPDEAAAVDHALRMVEEGADIIDVGGESTRPGSLPVAEDEELGRVLPVIRELRRRSPVAISIDTSKAAVAQAALGNGADMVNDVTGFRGDPEVVSAAVNSGASAIAMHLRGTPRTMQNDTHYRHLLGEVAGALAASARLWEAAGGHPDRLFLDPGVGFGKDAEGSRLLLRHLPALRSAWARLAVGASRKSFIARTLALTADSPMSRRLPASLAAAGLAVGGGAAILRVHDVRETVDYLRMAQALATPVAQGAAVTPAAP